jgi:hypothetical protein
MIFEVLIVVDQVGSCYPEDIIEDRVPRDASQHLSIEQTEYLSLSLRVQWPFSYRQAMSLKLLICVSSLNSGIDPSLRSRSVLDVPRSAS